MSCETKLRQLIIVDGLSNYLIFLSFFVSADLNKLGSQGTLHRSHSKGNRRAFTVLMENHPDFRGMLSLPDYASEKRLAQFLGQVRAIAD